MLTTETSEEENNGATPASFLSLVNSRKVASACIIELNEENGIGRGFHMTSTKLFLVTLSPPFPLRAKYKQS